MDFMIPPEFCGVLTFSSSSIYLQWWIRKYIPLGKTILPCWGWENIISDTQMPQAGLSKDGSGGGVYMSTGSRHVICHYHLFYLHYHKTCEKYHQLLLHVEIPLYISIFQWLILITNDYHHQESSRMYPCSTKTREVLGNPSPRDFPWPERFPEGEARGKSRGSKEISRADGMNFPISP